MFRLLATYVSFSLLVQAPIPTRVLSLEEMVGRADQIFRGIVIEVGEVPSPKMIGTIVRKVTIRVTEDIKGTLKGTNTFAMYQSRQFTSPVKVGDDVVWFMAPSSPDTGLSAPLGFSSGHFLVRHNLTSRELEVGNLNGNRGLLAGMEVGGRPISYNLLRSLTISYLRR